MRVWLAQAVLMLAGIPGSAWAQARVEYAGGTTHEVSKGASGDLALDEGDSLVLKLKKSSVRVPYERINLIEYGQQVNRRLLLAIAISPVFLLAKSRKHFLSIGYSDADGKQQALVFRVDKNGIRPTLVGLEARTGLKVQYQDEDARKAGKG